MTTAPPARPDLTLSPHTALWRMVALVVLALGLGASALAGAGTTTAERDAQRRAIVERADEVVHRISDERTRVFEVTRSLAALIGIAPDLTSTDVNAWFAADNGDAKWAMSPAFIFIERVQADDLPSFIAEVAADTPVMLDRTLGFEPIPKGLRPAYCLTRHAVSLAPGVLPWPAGVDVCAVLGPYTDAIRDGGAPEVLRVPVATGEVDPATSALDETARNLSGLFVVGQGVYRDGIVPATVAARRADLLGYAFAVYDPAGVVEHLAVEENLALTLRDAAGEALSSTNGPGHGVTVVGSVVLGREIYTVEVAALLDDHGWAVRKGVLTAIGGALVTLLLSMLLFITSRGRNAAVKLVEERTGELRHQALHDSLTGLPNRALILDRAAHLVQRNQRHQEPCATLFLDLDGFKEINDTVGHEAGDRLLCAVADRIKSVLRDSDTVGRLGGDEFVVLLEGPTMGLGPEVVAERILERIRAPFRLTDADIDFRVTASIGIAVGGSSTAGELLRDADLALYRAKDAGRDCSVVFRPEMHVAAQERMTLGMELRDALAHGALHLEYQPTFDVDSKRVKGVEALARWQHPTRGAISPLEFIPIAEDTGLIVELGRWVLHEACAQMAAWHALGYDLDLNVNVSARQLDRTDLVATVADALRVSGLAPDALVLELTESAFMTDPVATGERLAALKRLGVKIAIDDFGTGYSSLSYLRQFPIDAIKIDRSFLTDLGRSPEATALLHSLLQLGKNLGIETVAEGIEEESQLDYLRAEQCDSGQGFLFARPLTVEATARFLERRMRAPAAVGS